MVITKPGYSKTGTYIMLCFIMILFSTDLRFGLNLKLDSKPNFQLFELGTLLIGAFSIWAMPRFVLKFKFNAALEDLIICIFIANAFILAAFANDVNHSLSRAKDFMVCGFLYAVIRYGPLHKRHLENLLLVAVLLALFWSMVGICQWIGLDKDFGGEIYKLFLAAEAFRTKSVLDVSAGELIHTTFAHGIYLFPQNFVYFLLLPFAVSVAYARRKPACWLVAAIIFIAMVGTLSKTFILMFLAAAGFMLLRRYLNSSAIAAALFGCFSLLVIYYLASFANRSLLLKSLGTFIWRLDIWSDALTMLWEQPFVLLSGHGTELLESVYSRVNYPNPHNIVLYFLIEYGVVGCGLFFSFLFLLMRRAHSFIRSDMDDDNPVWEMLYYGLAFFLSMGIVDDIFVQTQMDGIFFFFSGILMRYITLESTKRNCPEACFTAQDKVLV